MSLIKSISGIRGTIGGKPNENLTPLDIVRFSAAFGTWVKESVTHSKKIIIGRDGRISGEMVRNLVVSTLTGLGLDVHDLACHPHGRRVQRHAFSPRLAGPTFACHPRQEGSCFVVSQGIAAVGCIPDMVFVFWNEPCELSWRARRLIC